MQEGVENTCLTLKAQRLTPRAVADSLKYRDS